MVGGGWRRRAWGCLTRCLGKDEVQDRALQRSQGAPRGPQRHAVGPSWAKIRLRAEKSSPLELIKRLFEKRICQVHVSQVAFNRLPEGRGPPDPPSLLGVTP